MSERFVKENIDVKSIFGFVDGADSTKIFLQTELPIITGSGKSITRLRVKEALEQYQSGNVESIHNYCETDVLNTYLVYLRYQFMRGELNNDELVKEYSLLREVLDKSDAAHLQQFSKSWD